MAGRFSRLETGENTFEESPEATGQPRPGRSFVGHAADSDTPDYDLGHYLNEGDRMFYAGDFKNALRRYSRAMQVDHSAVEPWIGQILALLQLKQKREATMWVLRALEMFPEDVRLISLQGLVMALTGSRQRAMACSDYAMTFDTPWQAFVWAMRAQILAECKNPNAGFCFDKVLETRQPGDWKTVALTGLFLVQAKKWSRAIEFLKLAIQSNPGNYFLWNNVGFASEHLGLTRQAVEAYQAVLERNPGDAKAREGLERVTHIPLPLRLWRRFFSR